MKQARIIAVCTSKDKGMPKANVHECEVLKGRGLKGDAHAGSGKRQVSLLAEETIAKMRSKAEEHGVQLIPGSFAENLTTEGIDLPKLPVGTTLKVGQELLLRITQIGKECHTGCAIRKAVGDCVMPREGVFAEVLNDGLVKVGDEIIIQEKQD